MSLSIGDSAEFAFSSRHFSFDESGKPVAEAGCDEEIQVVTLESGDLLMVRYHQR